MASAAAAAGITCEQLAKWHATSVIAPDRGVNDFTTTDVLIAALLGVLRTRRFHEAEIAAIANILNDAVRRIPMIAADRKELGAIIVEANLRLADEAGRFAEMVRSDDVDRRLAVFDTYSDYRAWSVSSGTAPAPSILTKADGLDDETLWLAELYFELTDSSYLATPGVTPFWDFVPAYGDVRIFSRGSTPNVPWDFADGTDVASFISVSLPVLVREISARRSSPR